MTEQEKREKVVKGLECCDAMHNGGEVKCANNCPYWLGYDGEINNNCRGALINDALEMLKSQEPVEPVFERTFLSDIEIYDCGKCGTSIGAKGIAKYCMECGQAVKWE